jgi:hypothetical protein
MTEKEELAPCPDRPTNVYVCRYCPKVGKQYAVSIRVLELAKFEVCCPNCKSPWWHFKPEHWPTTSEVDK